MVCADPGAAPPDCTTCLPTVCPGANGTCDTPCDTGGALFPSCDACEHVLEAVEGDAELGLALLPLIVGGIPEEAAALAVSAGYFALADLVCGALGDLTSFGTGCEVAVTAVDSIRGKVLRSAGSFLAGLSKMLITDGAIRYGSVCTVRSENRLCQVKTDCAVAVVAARADVRRR